MDSNLYLAVSDHYFTVMQRGVVYMVIINSHRLMLFLNNGPPVVL